MFCTTCGKKLPDDATFCDGCNTPIKKKNTKADSSKANPAVQENAGGANAAPYPPPQNGGQPQYVDQQQNGYQQTAEPVGAEYPVPQQNKNSIYTVFSYVSVCVAAFVSFFLLLIMVLAMARQKRAGYGTCLGYILPYGLGAIVNHFIIKKLSPKVEPFLQKLLAWCDRITFLFFAFLFVVSIFYNFIVMCL